MVSERVKKIKPSATLAIDTKAKAMKAQGIDVINFGVGEPDFDTPDHIKEAAVKAIRDGFTKYTPVGGIDELKHAIVEKLKRDNNLEYSKGEIIVSCGAKHSLYNCAQALYSPGDEVLIPSPYWVSYPDQVLLNDAIPVFVEAFEEDHFMIRQEALEAKITAKTKAIILNSPSNPTGVAYDRKTLEMIAEMALKHNFYIVSDEIYEKLIYDEAQHVSIASLDKKLKERAIVINGLSKSYAMTGWRIGYAAGPRDIIKAMTNIQSQSTSNPTSVAQKAAVAALEGREDFIFTMRAEFDRRRKFLVQGLNSIEGVRCLTPKGAFYTFPNIASFFGKEAASQTIGSSSDIALYLLEYAKVALVHGEPFGDDRYVRVSYATSMENIKEGLERMKQALSRFQ